MYWELWLSQVTATAALQCMLVQNKGEPVLRVRVMAGWVKFRAQLFGFLVKSI